MQSYLNREVIGVAITCSNTCHNIIVHVLDEGNVLCWDFVFLQGPPHNIPRNLIIGLLQVNEHHMQVLLLLPISLHKLSYQENGFHGRSPRHETKLIFGHASHSSYTVLNDSLP